MNKYLKFKIFYYNYLICKIIFISTIKISHETLYNNLCYIHPINLDSGLIISEKSLIIF